MTQILVCAHPWKLVQAKQVLWEFNEDKVTPAIYSCPICCKTKTEGEVDPRVILATLEETLKEK